MLFQWIQHLPDEIINIIWSKLNPCHIIFLNKENYKKFNYLIDGMVCNYESYIRDIIRNDYIFSFNYILNRQFKYWLHKRNYRYNDVIFPDYIHFLLNYSISNKASKCNKLINLQLNLSGLKKEWRKNNRIKYNKWNN
jgi:hypothetical protein